MSLRVIFAILSLGCLHISLLADEPKYEPIDAETVAAYEKLGGRYGGFSVVEFGNLKWTFRIAEEEAVKGLPGFYFGYAKEFPKLPPVKVPFGLQLAGPNLTDSGAKELRDLTNLTRLYLGGTKIGDSGMKELNNLTNLSTLYLSGTNVTDVGLKELKNLTKLTVLSLL